MTDENDGTYTYKYTPDNEGKMSIAVILYNRYSVLGKYYNVASPPSGTAVVSNFSSSINYNWGASDITPGRSTYVSVIFEAYVKAPITGTVTFDFYVDNYGALSIDGTSLFSEMVNG